MKKFLIAVICIIPIVVVLALSVTSNIILLTTPVNPESIVVKNSRNEVIEPGELITIDKDTEATGLPVYCRDCKTEIILDIERGRSVKRRSP